MAESNDTTETILAQIASYGPFLPGSVRKTTEKRVRKDGTVKVYDAMPIYTYTDPATGRQRSKRIPKDAYGRVRELTGKYKGMRRLIARFEAAAVAENLEGVNKKCKVRIAAHTAILKFDRRVALRSAMPAAFLCRQCIPASLHRAATSVLQADSIMPDPM